jgi:hypothetical protein
VEGKSPIGVEIYALKCFNTFYSQTFIGYFTSKCNFMVFVFEGKNVTLWRGGLKSAERVSRII